MAPLPVSQINIGHIDDVQELRKEKPNTVPERFIRDLMDRPSLDTVLLALPHNIPVIDLSKLVECNQDEFSSEIVKLTSACEDWGFFQFASEHRDLAKKVFMPPLEEKQKYPMLQATVQGYGQAFVFSEDQKLDWCNMFALGVEPPCIRKPRLWPTKPPKFSETIEDYSRQVRKLCEQLLKYITISLGLKPDIFKEMFGVAVQAIRMNYYPPCSRTDLVLGFSPHSDGSALTALQQAKDGSVGLQILKDEKWVPVQPTPNAFVINIGDTIEVLTNGKYKCVEHRAVTDKEKDRLSLVTFYAPSYEIEIGPIEELVSEENSCKYRRYDHGEYNKNHLTNRLQGKKALEFAKIANYK